MKTTNLVWLLAAGLLASQIPSLTFDIQPATAATKTLFKCVPYGSSQEYGTIALTIDQSNGKVLRRTTPLINWRKWDFAAAGYTPSVRCNSVTDELNRVVARHGGKLSNVWLTSWRSSNGYPVICYIEQRLGKCTQESILITLSRENARNPNEALRRLLNYSEYGTGLPIEETEGTDYVNLEKLVEAASTDSNPATNSSETNPSTDSPVPSTPEVPTGDNLGPI